MQTRAGDSVAILVADIRSMIQHCRHPFKALPANAVITDHSFEREQHDCDWSPPPSQHAQSPPELHAQLPPAQRSQSPPAQHAQSLADVVDPSVCTRVLHFGVGRGSNIAGFLSKNPYGSMEKPVVTQDITGLTQQTHKHTR